MKSIIAVHRGIHLCSKCFGWDIVIWAALALLPQQLAVCFQDGCRPSRERVTCSRKSNGRPLTLQVRSPSAGRCRGSSHAGRPPILLGNRCRSSSLASCTSCAKPSSHRWSLACSSSASSAASAAIAVTPLLTNSSNPIRQCHVRQSLSPRPASRAPPRSLPRESPSSRRSSHTQARTALLREYRSSPIGSSLLEVSPTGVSSTESPRPRPAPSPVESRRDPDPGPGAPPLPAAWSSLVVGRVGGRIEAGPRPEDGN